MLKVAAIVFVFLGATLAGMAVTAVVSIPALAAESGKWITIAGLGGFAVAIPASWIVAKMIEGNAARGAERGRAQVAHSR